MLYEVITQGQQGPQGIQGPQGPSGIPEKVVVIEKLSWDLFTSIPAQTLVELLPSRGLAFSFSGALDGSLIEKARGYFLRVRLHGQNNQLYSLPGKITFSSLRPNVIIWICTLSSDVLAKYLNYNQETSLQIDRNNFV